MMILNEGASIEELLLLREDIDKQILDRYSDKLYRVFQIIYGFDANVEWYRLFRFSSESNFIIVGGKAKIDKGSEVLNQLNLPANADHLLIISYTIPWKMLDDESTTYQIAEAIKSLAMFRDVVDQKIFSELINNPNFTIEDIDKYLPKKPMEQNPVMTSTPKLEETVPPSLTGFDLDSLTEAQKLRLMLSYKIK